MDIFISYNWKIKTQVKELYEILTKQLKFKVWLDDEQLNAGYPLFSELAKAIDDSKVFICCLTTDYCKSKNCNREFKYADDSNKPIIILKIDNLKSNEITKIKITETNKECGIGFAIGYIYMN